MQQMWRPLLTGIYFYFQYFFSGETRLNGKRHYNKHCPISVTNTINQPPKYPNYQCGHILGYSLSHKHASNCQVLQFYLTVLEFNHFSPAPLPLPLSCNPDDFKNFLNSSLSLPFNSISMCS